MPRTAQKPGAPALPSKDDILAFMRSEADAGRRKVGKRDIARAFGLRGDLKLELKRLLREIEDEGDMDRRGRMKAKGGHLPPMVVVDIVGRNRDGELLARPTDWDDENLGDPPAIVIEPAPRGRIKGPAAGVGDRALVRVAHADRDEAAAGPFGARIVKLLDRARQRQFGVFQSEARSGGGRILPVDRKSTAIDWLVPEAERNGAEDGELVAVDLIGRPRALGPRLVRVVERLGSTKSEKAVSMIAVLTHGIPHVFRRETLEEADRARPPSLEAREDWRAIPFVTIDPPDAKDHDDAVHAEEDPDPANPGGTILSVAIADVAALVRPGTAMDREALERGNSVYFPDRVVPMLPERISTDLGSLRPQEDRAALAVRMVIGADGRKRRHSFHRVMIRSAAKLSYAQVQAAADGAPDEMTASLQANVLGPLWAVYAAVAEARDKRSPLALDLPERKLVLDAAGRVERVIVPPRLEAHRLIEEFMILANVAAAETLEARQQSLVYRVHDEPSLAKLTALREFLMSIGIKFAKGQVMKPGLFNTILERVRGTEHEHVVSEVVLRSQAQAEYAVENYGHFGLNLPRYAHFTSPIRRYADLLVHRALVRALGLGGDGLPDLTRKELGEMAAAISAAERRAMAAERDTIDRLIAGFLADRIGDVFEARIGGVTKAGFFVRLAETGADGFVPAARLGDEYFSYDESGHSLTGSRTGTAYRLGDRVEVRLVEATPLAGALRFDVAGSNGKTSDNRTRVRRSRRRS